VARQEKREKRKLDSKKWHKGEQTATQLGLYRVLTGGHQNASGRGTRSAEGKCKIRSLISFARSGISSPKTTNPLIKKSPEKTKTFEVDR